MAAFRGEDHAIPVSLAAAPLRCLASVSKSTFRGGIMAPTAGVMTELAQPPKSPRRARALLLGDRINTSNMDRVQVVCPSPLTYRCGPDGFVTLFRYGVAVLIGLSPSQEDEVLRDLRPRVSRPLAIPDEESAFVEIDPARDDQILPGGPITLKVLTPEHLILIADALSKSVVLARDEREVAA